MTRAVRAALAGSTRAIHRSLGAVKAATGTLPTASAHAVLLARHGHGRNSVENAVKGTVESIKPGLRRDLGSVRMGAPRLADECARLRITDDDFD